MVGHHVAVAAVLVVAVIGLDLGERRAPIVAVLRVPAADVADHPVQDTVVRNLADADVDELVGVGFLERGGFHRRENLGAVDRLAVVGHAGGTTGEVRRLLWIARRDHRPAVDEDLRADLFGHHLAVHGDRAARRGVDARRQAHVGRVFRRVAEAAPPQDRAVLDQVVEPGLADLLRGQLRVAVVVFECADERERAADVVVGDDQRHVELVVDVVVDLAEALFDAFIGPALEGAAEVDADDLAEHAGIDALLVVGG